MPVPSTGSSTNADVSYLSPSSHQTPSTSDSDVSGPQKDPLGRRPLLWQLKDLRMLVGTDLAVFGGPQHPCISLRLAEAGQPISVLTGIDYWLDNLMNDVPEVAMCYHTDGLVQNYEILSTDDLPEISGFDPEIVTNAARNLLYFLRNRAAEEGHTYWLFKAPDSDYVKLYDLTRLCESLGQANPFSAPVGLLCLRVAQKRWNWLLRSGGIAGPSPTRKEVANLLKLLHHAKVLLDSTEQPLYLADAYNLYSEVVLRGRLSLQQQRRQRRRRHSDAAEQYSKGRDCVSECWSEHRGEHRRYVRRTKSQSHSPKSSPHIDEPSSSALVRSVSPSAADLSSCRPAIISLQDLRQKTSTHAVLDQFSSDVAEASTDSESSASSSTDEEYAPPNDDELATRLAVKNAFNGFKYLSAHSSASSPVAKPLSSYYMDRDRIPISNPLVAIPLSYDNKTETADNSSAEINTTEAGVVAVKCENLSRDLLLRKSILRNAASAHFTLAEQLCQRAVSTTKKHPQACSKRRKLLRQALSNSKVALRLWISSNAELQDETDASVDKNMQQCSADFGVQVSIFL